ncbi:MAG TPA: hypothetical protein VK737_01445 [Opitutales bacterium]|jgi:prepilin-type processing-associated H-X9-DG protein|nr:hypothetical protein [Opitutales bacterium]
MSSKNKNAPVNPAGRAMAAGICLVVLLVLAWGPVTAAVDSAHRSAAYSNLHSLAGFYVNHTHPNGQAQPLTAGPNDTTYSVAQLFAQADQFNDANAWFVKSDPQLDGASIPTTVMDPQTGQMNSTFSSLPLAYEFAATINPAAQPLTTPIAWTRGLRDDGTWAPDSPWQGKGGHIAFLDGHVIWCDRVSNLPAGETMVRYGTNIATQNIREALPPGAVVLSSEPRK